MKKDFIFNPILLILGIIFNSSLDLIYKNFEIVKIVLMKSFELSLK